MAALPARVTALLAACTLVLIFAGGLVTSTGSGLAVPDWPLSFGQVFPRMEGGVLYEHGHRMIATAVGIVTIVVAVVLQRADSRAWVRRLGWAALVLVTVQGVLGGITVLLRLPTAVSVSHAGTAQLFFATTILLATVTSRGWHSARQTPWKAAHTDTRILVLATAIAIYLQILIGAVVRHTGAGLVIPDFPLSYGRLIPEFASPLVAWQFAHRVGAVVVGALALWTGARLVVRHAAEPWLVRPAWLLMVGVLTQIMLGAFTIWMRKDPWITTAHVATGALLFATAVALVIRTTRVLPIAAAPQLMPRTAA